MSKKAKGGAPASNKAVDALYGIAEEILDALARVEGLHVAGRTSSFAFKGKNEDLRTIGQRLNVSTILDGSVHKEGRRVRIAAEIVNVADGYRLWSKTFD